MGYHNKLYSKCAQMGPQQLPKTSKFYSRSKKCDIEKTLGVGTTPPIGSPKVNTMSYKERIDRLDVTALLKPLGLSGASIMGGWGSRPRFWAGSLGGVEGVVGGPERVAKYYYILSFTESIFESDDF